VKALLRSLPQYPFSVAKARAERARSAYPNGFTTSIDAPEFVNRAEISQVIADELQQIGIKMQVNSTPLSDWIAEILGPNDGLGFSYLEIEDSQPDPSTYPSVFLGSKNARAGGLNFANSTPPAIDDLIKQGTTIQNPRKAPCRLRAAAAETPDRRAVRPALQPGRRPRALEQVHVADVRPVRPGPGRLADRRAAEVMRRGDPARADSDAE
jgi:hypothetical protein